MKKIAFLIWYGSEARIFFNEWTRAQVGGGIAFYKTNNSKYLVDYFSSYNIDNISKKIELPDKHILIGQKFKSARIARNKMLGRKNFQWVGEASNSLQVRDFLFGNPLVYFVTERIYRTMLLRYRRSDLERMFTDNNVDEVWLAGHGTAPEIAFAVNAKEAGCLVKLFIKTWKQAYVNSYIPSVFDEVHVWNDMMRKDYLNENPHINSSIIKVSGNPRFTALATHEPKHQWDFYKSKYKIQRRDVVLYTAIDPRNYSEEPRIVYLIVDLLYKKLGYNAPHFLVKPNPMDASPDRWNVFNRDDRISVMDSNWEWIPNEDFNMPSISSEVEWFDLLKYCMMTMNIASTVTVESLVCGKPVVNIGFDKSGVEAEVCIRYAQQPYYQPLFNRNDVVLAHSLNDVVSAYLAMKSLNNQQGLDDIVKLPFSYKMNRKN